VGILRADGGISVLSRAAAAGQLGINANRAHGAILSSTGSPIAPKSQHPLAVGAVSHLEALVLIPAAPA